MSGDAFVVGLGAPEALSLALVGSKAAGLADLLQAGFSVPGGAVVTSRAFRSSLRPVSAELATLLGTPSLGEPSVASDVAARCARVLERIALPQEVARGLQDLLDDLAQHHSGSTACGFAVRSSATAEDLAETSFAGLYDTLLGLRDAAAVAEAVLACWRSFFSAHALVARVTAGRAGAHEAMAVLVQPMIDAECSGVIHSVDPVRRRRDLIVIESAWGLGLGTVDGAVENDVARVHRPTMRLDEHQVVLQPELIALAEGGGIERIAVEPERSRAASLDEHRLLRLAQVAVALETRAGAPQDVEWAIADDRIWLLQSRPLTALPEALAAVPPFPVAWPTPDDARRPWSLSIASREHVPSALEHDITDAFSLAIDDAITFAGATFFESTRLALFNGRRYLTPVPGPHRPGDVRVRTRAMHDLNRRLLQEHGLTAWDHWGPEVIRATERLRAFDPAAADAAATAAHLEDALATFRRSWMIHWLLWFPPLDEFLDAHRALVGAEERAAPETLLPLLDGEDSPLTRLIDGLFELASLARAEPAVRDAVHTADADALKRLQDVPGAATFLQRFARFLAEHGDRTGTGYGSTIAIRTPTWREEPERVLPLLAPYLGDDVEAPAAARERTRARRDAEVDALCAGKDDELVLEFRRQLALARKDAVVLEEHNHAIDQLSTAQLRAAVMAAGAYLARLGLIPDAESVYSLHVDEIVRELRDGAAASEAALAERREALAGTLAQRRDDHARWSLLTPPPILGVPDPQLRARGPLRDEVTARATGAGAGSATGEGEAPAMDVVAGTGASAGRHRGRARVVTELVAVPDVQPGDVLVAVNAGPMWTPIFPILGGLVLDHGAVTQHSAATAREYGVPAVVATRNATRRIADGATVEIDGATGTVVVVADDVAVGTAMVPGAVAAASTVVADPDPSAIAAVTHAGVGAGSGASPAAEGVAEAAPAPEAPGPA